MTSRAIFPLTFCFFLTTGCLSEAAFSVRQPIDDALNRPTPLSFGVYVTPDPEQNPIDPPERFTGYHVGLDYEVTEEELERDVPIYSICTGEIVSSSSAEGYGGLLVQRCRLGREDVTVLYGHLAREGLPDEGREVEAGEQIGILAPARSDDSGHNRKHLHLGIHRGEELDFRGYVQEEEEIQEFIDPKTVLPQWGFGQVIPDSEPYWQTD